MELGNVSNWFYWYNLPVEIPVRNASNAPERAGFYAWKIMERYGRILNMEGHGREEK